MPKCTICSHPQRRQIDRAIAHGERNIATRFNISRSAVCRHRHHITDAIAKAHTVEATEAMSLLDQVRQVAADARRITNLAEKRGKLSIALGGLREVSRNLELIGRLSGELQNGGINVGVAVNSLSPVEERLVTEHRRQAGLSSEEREAQIPAIEAEIQRIEVELARCGWLKRAMPGLSFFQADKEGEADV